MKIQLNGHSAAELHREAEKGARFVYYTFTLSLLVTTLKRNSGIYMIRPGESRVKKGLPFTVLTFLLGWWAIPFGPKHTVEALRTNIKGGKDITDEVDAILAGHLLFMEAQKAKKEVQPLRKMAQ